MNASEHIARAEEELGLIFDKIDAREVRLTRKVLDAFRKEGVSYRHFAPTTGYGYDDIGRDTLERIYADLFHTEAALMPGQLSDAVRQERARQLIAVGEKTAAIYRRSWLGRETELLPEEIVGGCWEGYTPEYIRVRLNPGAGCVSGRPVRILVTSVDQPTVVGEII